MIPSKSTLTCSKLLAENKLTVAFAESATAGSVCAAFSLCPESGSVLKGGLVCYDADLKESILHVPKDMLRTHTPESAEVTKELAERLQLFIPADLHIAITGLTSPGGSEAPEKPVGTIFYHLAAKNKSVAERKVFSGSPQEIVTQSIDYLAEWLLREIPASHAPQPE